MGKVKVIVCSSVNSGKSTIAQIIHNALLEHGISSEIADDFLPTSDLSNRVDAIKESTVLVETAQVNRMATAITINDVRVSDNFWRDE